MSAAYGSMELMDPTSSQARISSGQATPAAEETTLPVIREHIVRTPGTCWGKPRIAGTRIKVEQVVLWHERQGMSPAEIVSTWPHLTLADVHAALAYYHDHREEIEADLAEGERLFEALKAKQPSLLDKIRRRQADAPDDPLPPG
jgi:uncharacterized protein (DUF433 family)